MARKELTLQTPKFPTIHIQLTSQWLSARPLGHRTVTANWKPMTRAPRRFCGAVSLVYTGAFPDNKPTEKPATMRPKSIMPMLIASKQKTYNTILVSGWCLLGFKLWAANGFPSENVRNHLFRLDGKVATNIILGTSDRVPKARKVQDSKCAVSNRPVETPMAGNRLMTHTNRRHEPNRSNRIGIHRPWIKVQKVGKITFHIYWVFSP